MIHILDSPQVKKKNTCYNKDKILVETEITFNGGVGEM